MPVSSNFLEFVLDQLRNVGTVRSRRMFGGIGLYCDELFFALIADDVVYFKVDDANRMDYTARGMDAFRPFPDDPNTVSMNYFRVPGEVLEDIDTLPIWARKSLAAAAAAATAKALRERHKSPARRARKSAKTPRKR